MGVPLRKQKIRMIHVQAHPIDGEMGHKRRHGCPIHFYIYIEDCIHLRNLAVEAAFRTDSRDMPRNYKQI